MRLKIGCHYLLKTDLNHEMNQTQSNHSDLAISAYGTARSTVQGAPLSSEELREIDEYWRASLYLCLGMLYLQDNPLLREPLKIEHVKPRMLGHWGSDAGQTFTYIHFNRLIKKYDPNAIYLSGPGHGAPSVLSQGYLEGTYSEIYPDKSEDLAGLQRFFRQFSFPGGIRSHATPETPGSINEGGELGSVATLQSPGDRLAGCSSWHLRFAVYSSGGNLSRRSSCWRWDGTCAFPCRTATAKSCSPTRAFHPTTSRCGDGFSGMRPNCSGAYAAT